MKVVKFCCVLCLLPLLCCGCQDYEGYTGNYPELFSVAVNSIPDAKGCLLGGEITHQPILCFIEEDNYARKMFVYSEIRDPEDQYGNTYDNRQIYLMICQAAIDGYAYYYNEKNLVVSVISDFPTRIKYGGTGQVSSIKEPLKDFSTEMITQLKNNNDWGKEVDIDKCKKVKIIRRIN